MKIGILTFHFGTNYGGILQCYALQQVLKMQGHEVEIINYRGIYKVTLVHRVVNKLKTIANLRAFSRLIKESILRMFTSNQTVKISHSMQEKCMLIFNDFRRNFLSMSESVNEDTISRLADRYDAVIVGSDQVWTSLYDKHSIYFLNWLPNDYKGKRIAYAACSAHSFVQPSRSEDLNKYLSRFDLITVRDLTTQNLVKQITGKKVSIVADPTLLYDFKDFVSEQPESPYILCYILGNEIKDGHKTTVTKIRKELGNITVKAILVPHSPNDIAKYVDDVYDAVTPQQWVNMFAHASFVYTDSFHGVMFSLKYDKPFFAYYTDLVRSSRLLDLKDRFPELNINESLKNKILCKGHGKLLEKMDRSFRV